MVRNVHSSCCYDELPVDVLIWKEPAFVPIQHDEKKHINYQSITIVFHDRIYSFISSYCESISKVERVSENKTETEIEDICNRLLE
jgi:hypothetical protein